MTTLASMKTQIINYTENDDTEFSDELNNIIRAAEENIANAVDIPQFRTRTSTTFTASSPNFTIPSDFLRMRFMYFVNGSSDKVYLLPKADTFIEGLNLSTGEPRYYALRDEDIGIVAPTPNSGYTYTIGYIKRPPSLVDNSGGTWLSINHKNAIFYGALLETYGNFMRGEEEKRVAAEQLFGQALARLKELGSKATDDSYRHKEIM